MELRWAGQLASGLARQVQAGGVEPLDWGKTCKARCGATFILDTKTNDLTGKSYASNVQFKAFRAPRFLSCNTASFARLLLAIRSNQQELQDLMFKGLTSLKQERRNTRMLTLLLKACGPKEPSCGHPWASLVCPSRQLSSQGPSYHCPKSPQNSCLFDHALVMCTLQLRFYDSTRSTRPGQLESNNIET